MAILIDQTQPVGIIHPQALSSLPLPTGTVLVDDPIALVDDPNALTGSQTTQVAVLRTETYSNAPKAFIKKRR